ncbi:MAG: hypothetical protein ACRENF_00565 [Thermodesulfobacteriota bacterium]
MKKKKEKEAGQVVPLPGSLIEKLEDLLQKAKNGSITEFACFYLKDDRFCYSHDFKWTGLPTFLGWLELWKIKQVEKCSLERDGNATDKERQED